MRTIHDVMLIAIQTLFALYADIAQLVEQLICNQQVVGSSPIISSSRCYVQPSTKGLHLLSESSRSAAL